jgi:hypothetical protein
MHMHTGYMHKHTRTRVCISTDCMHGFRYGRNPAYMHTCMYVSIHAYMYVRTVTRIRDDKIVYIALNMQEALHICAQTYTHTCMYQH